MKLHLNESLFESWWDDEISSFKEPETVSELIGSKVVYHATYKPYWEEIKKEGFIKSGKHQNWNISQSYIYLSKDYYNALSYAETAEDVPEELLNQIIVLEIDADKLDVDHLDPDHNQVYDYDGEVQLEDPLTWVELQYDLPIPVSAVKKVHDESELNEEMEKSKHHQMTYYNAKNALQNYILKYGRIDGPFELYYNFRLTPSEIKDILSYALNNKMINEYQKDQVLNNLEIKEDQIDEVISVPGVPDKPTAEDKYRYFWELEFNTLKTKEDLLRRFKMRFPEQYEIWGETIEYMIEHDQNTISEPQDWAIQVYYDLEDHWGYICVIEFKTRFENTLNEVYPNKGESKEDFISRFMKETKSEYPDIKQRYAIALSYWNKKNLKEDFKTDLDLYIAGGYSIKDFGEDTQDFINSHTQITTWPLYRFDSLIPKDLTLGSEIQLDGFKSFSMSEKGRDRVWEDIQENEKDTSNYCLLKTSGRVRCFDIKKYSSNTNYSYQDEVLARGWFKIIKIDKWKGVLQYTVTQSNDQMSESYLDPEEKFWDYRTKEVDGDQYIDETRNEIGWVRDLLDDPKYYEQRKGYTARIIEMTPEEYFEECAKIFGNSVENQKRQTAADKDTLDHLTQVITKYKKRFPIPFINIKDRTQEGRHRMYVLGELLGWDKKFPVLIIQDINNIRVPGKEIE